MWDPKVSKLSRAGLIGAAYVALTLAFAPISYGAVQFRVSEVLTLFPFLWPEAAAGLVVGCLISNLLGGLGWVDVVFGTLATGLAAYLTMRARNEYWAALWPVLVNGLVVGGYLSVLLGMPWYLSMAYVAVGEAGVCFGLGVPLVKALRAMPLVSRLVPPRGGQ
ncbi:protein of unknown function DUF988 [Thermanaerovibrio acidaminovorans DSM 6589]|jgi:uncharacterized membrane protein|uniref:QueT transporter n=1 Tax=Thermanaerovibrio acidaminovorans (strain ATCC 49978 / DSM 6589 / Su883) TaxID=525903 RepID=D1B894_THEAS|nr:QueT transporter family protein [Thermanaerovibrio acidaminovorans]ACZ18497.1 protein of unknown function DUF988 [Thermanaerovibrio acidaminovorans DSM 6589]